MSNSAERVTEELSRRWGSTVTSRQISVQSQAKDGPWGEPRVRVTVSLCHGAAVTQLPGKAAPPASLPTALLSAD